MNLHFDPKLVQADVPVIVERKGCGHPDTLADWIAEQISLDYSLYCLKEFGIIPNHWVDKVVLRGGASNINFGRGQLISPIEVYVFGKVTHSVGHKKIPFHDLFVNAARKVLQENLRIADFHGSFSFFDRTVSSKGVGRPSSWYAPRDATDICSDDDLKCNDAALAVGESPLPPFYACIRHLEGVIRKHRVSEPTGVGSDIKVVAQNTPLGDGGHIDVVCAIPLIADLTPSRARYDEVLEELKETIANSVAGSLVCDTLSVKINTRDDAEEVYLLSQGSALDTGDVGVVGRGNRVNGLITPFDAMSIEAPHGKNPRYHSGRLYSLASQWIAEGVASRTGGRARCAILATTGDSVFKPRKISVAVDRAIDVGVRSAVEEVVEQFPEMLRRFIASPLEQSLFFVKRSFLI